MIKEKVLLSFILLILAILFVSCGGSGSSSSGEWRLNVKDGENINNERGFGRFNTGNSPALKRQVTPPQSPRLAVFLTEPFQGLIMTGNNAHPFLNYGIQGHSEKRQKSWSIDLMKDAVGLSIVGATHGGDPCRFYVR